MKEQIIQLQGVFKASQDAAQITRRIVQEDLLANIYDLEHVCAFAKDTVRELNEFLQLHRVFCVSEVMDSFKMWTLYAQDHHGIVLRILPNLQKDSKFQLFRKVEYRAKRPSLYDSGVSFVENAVFGDRDTNNHKVIDRIIYTKTLEWEHEKEHRLVIPVVNDKPWNLMPYHPEELIELYLGAKIKNKAKGDIIELVKAVNPNIAIFQCYTAANDAVRFHIDWASM
jgi:hypothetical protein